MAFVLDPDGNAIYTVGKKGFQRLEVELGPVHETRVYRKACQSFKLVHGPQDLGLKTYGEAIQLFKLIRDGSSLAQGLQAVKEAESKNAFDVKSAEELVARLQGPFDTEIDGSDDIILFRRITSHARRSEQQLDGDRRHEALGHMRQKPDVTSTPLPRELTTEERRAIWQPPIKRR